MNLDFLQLKDFNLFYETELGTKVKETIVKKIYKFWPELKNELKNELDIDSADVENENSERESTDNGGLSNKQAKANIKKQKLVGIGYTAPYLKLIDSDSYKNLSILSGEIVVNDAIEDDEFLNYASNNDADVTSNLYNLPFKDSSIDKIIVLHSLEFSNNQSKFLREIWRVLKDNGKIIFIVPNRLSIWSKIHKTPFGHGHPYSPQQLENLLSGSMFTLTRVDIDIFVPPVHITLFNKIIIFLHFLSSKISSFMGGFIFGGAIIAEARKEIFGMTPTGGEKVTFKETVSAKDIHKNI